jgi:hypothetical protein
MMWTSICGRISSSSVHCAARSIVLAAWLFLVAYVTIPDYPYGVPLWQSLCLDANGYWHEVFYISVGAAAFVFSSILWQALQTWRNVGILLGGVLKRLEKDL